MLVLGVDVGIQVCGFCICGVRNLEVNLFEDGEVKPPRVYPLAQKLNYIFEELEGRIDKYHPETLIIEKLYSHYRHPATLGLLAQIRGVVVLLSYKKGLELFEYSPTQARKSFLGRGSVNSFQVKKMAEGVTGKKFKSIHTADAFSLAVAFSHTQKFRRIMSSLEEVRK